MAKELNEVEYLGVPIVNFLLVWDKSGSLALAISAHVLGFLIKAALVTFKGYGNDQISNWDKQLLEKIPEPYLKKIHYLSYILAGCLVLAINSFFNFSSF